MRNLISNTIICSSIVIAIILSLIPLPNYFTYYRPSWLILVLMFWSIYHSDRVNLFSAWTAGLIFDILTNSLLGQNALSLLFTSFAAVNFKRRFTRAPWIENMLLALTIIFIFHLVYNWIGMSIGQIQPTWMLLIPIFSSLLFWPIISFCLYKLARFI